MSASHATASKSVAAMVNDTGHAAIDHYIDRINRLLEDESISDIMINRHDRVFIERSGKMEPADFTFESPDLVNQLAHIIIRICNKEHVAEKHPVIDGMLPDGNRVTVVLSPVAVDGAGISIRKFAKKPLQLEDMQRQNQMTAQMTVFLKAAIAERANILISGGTSTGKTTFLNALSININDRERIVTIEDTPELRIQHSNVVRMEITGHNRYDGEGVSARELVKSSLRMRPDRIIMGEIRGEEAFDFLQAINTGHDGSMATVHANSPREAFNRIENMVVMANASLPVRFIRQQVSSALDLIIQMDRDENGRRSIAYITEIVGLEGETVIAQDIFSVRRGNGLDTPTYAWNSSTSRNGKVQKALQSATDSMMAHRA